LNSITVHTIKEHEINGGKILKTSPIVIVGTCKDVVSNSAVLRKISNLLNDKFQDNVAFKSIMKNGTLNFFPVNNKLGRGDNAILKLMEKIVEKMNKMKEVKAEKNISWLRAVDALQLLKDRGSILLSEAVAVLRQCEIQGDEVYEALQFFHDMGILLWFNQANLKETIIIDPLQCFVQPITRIICDPTLHYHESHGICVSNFKNEWLTFRSKGFASRNILRILLGRGTDTENDFIILLMEKFSLSIQVKIRQQVGTQITFLIPALLPLKKTQILNYENGFLMYFYIGDTIVNKSYYLIEELKTGFLPKAIFEYLVSKCLSWSRNFFYENSNENVIFSNNATIQFGKHKFTLILIKELNCIYVSVDKKAARSLSCIACIT
jgi:hypothetical protein